MKEVYVAVVSIYFSRGYYAAVEYLEGVGFSNARDQLNAAIKIYYGQYMS